MSYIQILTLGYVQVFSVQSMSASASAPATVTSETGEDLPRVLVVTSIKFLSLLAICRQGSEDGTFASMSKLWKQLFMFLGNLDNSHIPICWGYLPDKSFRSYYVFLYMVLFAFRGRREEIIKITSVANLKMKQIKCDYEIGKG